MEIQKYSCLFIKSEEISPEIADFLEKLNCVSYRIKLLSFEYNLYANNLKKALENIKDFTALAFNSVNSVIALKNLSDVSLFEFIKENLDIFVVGEKTLKLIEKDFQRKAAICGKNYENLIEKINEYTQNVLKKQKVLYFIGTLSDLSKSINKPINWEYQEIVSYGTREVSEEEFQQQIKQILKDNNGDLPRILVYFSASNVRFFMNFLEKCEKSLVKSLENLKHICFGQKTYDEFEVFQRKFKENGVVIKNESVFISKLSTIKEILEIIEKIIKL